MTRARPAPVRCLGPRRPEHTFASRDPATNRVCPRCQKVLDALRVGRAGDSVVVREEQR